MGRRSRRRSETRGGENAARSSQGQTARVSVDDATWRDFRSAIGDRSVSQVLGSFVEAEVTRWHKQRAEGASLTETEILAAIERARALSETLRLLAGRLETRLHHERSAGNSSARPP